ncbi:MAG: hypothetical protein EOM91_05870 [Sphingobacteriia bacterium]|nr:hypothetical protein [Sphingobacteriia bacterium]NCC37872.1 hypothetical protein [Gammaproteobacteria bacterium]
MDSEAFRQTYRELNERFCVFEKGILTRQCDCSQARKSCIAEREGVECGSDEAQSRCQALLDILRRQARFALKTSPEQGALPHIKAMRLQIGGLRGIVAALDPTAPQPKTIGDVHGLLESARERFGDFAHLPFARIMQEIARYQPRRRRERG